MNNLRNVAIIYLNGDDPDLVDSLECVNSVTRALKKLKFPVLKFDIEKENFENCLQADVGAYFNFAEDHTWDIYFKTVRMLLDQKKILISHSKGGLKYLLDKKAVKRHLIENKIPTPNYLTINAAGELNNLSDMSFPIIVKPTHEHAGIGIGQKSVVGNISDLKKLLKKDMAIFGNNLELEEYIEGREIHVTVLGNGNNLEILPFCEVKYGPLYKNKWKIYSYNSKWNKNTWEYKGARIVIPKDLSEKLSKQIIRVVKKSYKIFFCTDIARFDLRIDKNNKPYVIDVNYNPSLNYYDKQDATVLSAKYYGWDYTTLINKIVNYALARK